MQDNELHIHTENVVAVERSSASIGVAREANRDHRAFFNVCCQQRKSMKSREVERPGEEGGSTSIENRDCEGGTDN